jgi:hypothetical protein
MWPPPAKEDLGGEVGAAAEEEWAALAEVDPVVDSVAVDLVAGEVRLAEAADPAGEGPVGAGASVEVVADSEVVAEDSAVAVAVEPAAGPAIARR